MSIPFGVAIGLLALPTLSFVLLYPAASARLVRVDSPYPKAAGSRRLVAAAIDLSLLGGCLYFVVNSGSPWFAGAGAAYAAGRDAIWGRSVGKFVAGLAVVSLENGNPCSLFQSLRRNGVFLFPGVNVAALVLEGVAASRDPFGYRLGDLLARTQVVQGFGARDAAGFVADWIRPPSGLGRVRGHGAVGL